MFLKEDGAQFYAKIVARDGRAMASFEVVMQDRLGLRVEEGVCVFETDAAAAGWLREQAGVHGFAEVTIERPAG